MIESPESSADAGPAAAAVSADMLPLELVILDHYSRQSRCLVGSLPAILGRGDKDDVRLADPWMSHSHCELFRQGGVVVVRDLDSKNGVFMHGLRVREAEVPPGECLTLGRTEITLRYRRVTREMIPPQHGLDARAPAPGARRPNAGGPTTEELLY